MELRDNNPTEILVTAFGIEPNSGKDCIEGIRTAIESVSDKGAWKLLFPKGRYDFKNEEAIEELRTLMSGELHPDTKWGRTEFPFYKAISINNEENFIIDGQGSTFVFHGLVQPFEFINCQNFQLSGIKIQWERPLFSNGILLAVDGELVTVEIDEHFSLSDGGPVWTVMSYDPFTKRFGHVAGYGAGVPLVHMKDNIYTFKAKGFERFRIGMGLNIRHLHNYRPGIYIERSSQVSIQDVTINEVPGMGVIGFQSHSIQFERFQVRPRMGQMMSTNTDATHFISCTGEISFEDCYFEGMGDDAANVHGFYLSIQKIIDSYTLMVTIDTSDITQSRKFDSPFVGDLLEFVSADDLHCVSENRVKSIEVDEHNWNAKIVLENPIELNNNSDMFLIANATRTAKLTFRNSIVTNHRARALLIQTRDALVENCLFDSCTGTGIHVNTASGWKESIGTRDITIRNNTFRKCGYGAGTIRGTSAIAITTESNKTWAGVHQRVRIENNTIQGLSNTGILISATSEGVIANNIFDHCRPSIQVEYSEHITFVDNVEDGQYRITAEVDVGEGCSEIT